MCLAMQEMRIGTVVSGDSTSVGPLSPRAPQLLSLCSRPLNYNCWGLPPRLLKPGAPESAFCSQKPPQWGASFYSETREEPRSLQIERAGFLQPRPSATKDKWISKITSVQFSHSVVSSSLRPCEPQHPRPPCPSPTPGVHSDSCPLSPWCHPAISSSVVRFSSCP